MIIKERLLFGIHSVLEALESNTLIDKIYIRKGMGSTIIKKIKQMANLKLIPVQEIPIEKLNRLTKKAHQGCIAVISPIEYTDIEQLIPALYERGEAPFFVVLDGITDTRNFGAIARSALCAGAHAIVIPMRNSVSVTADAVNASAGALIHMPICRVSDLSKTVNYLAESGLNIVIANEKAMLPYYQAPLKGPLALVMGNEHTGVSEKIRDKANIEVSIPLQGTIGSLNVSVATGILLFDIARRRDIKE